ncbi:DUF4136 domain-containing protein [Salinimicrobium catena]|uniref:DUF4136 domain-containing protein n=1 Tax=Salinimicrobium catena TaxID=390640 RepID=UPI002FE43A0A
MKKFNLIILLMLSTLLTSCGPRVSTSKTASVDLDNYDTFAYLPNSNIDAEGLRLDSDQVSQAVIEAVNTNFRQEGYNLDRQNPDLLVLIDTATDTEVTTTTDPVYATYPYTTGVTTVNPYYDPYYYSGYASYNNIIGYDTDTYAYQEGTVVIHLIDRESRNTVWKGVASESLAGETNVQGIKDLVNAIFEEYPLSN